MAIRTATLYHSQGVEVLWEHLPEEQKQVVADAFRVVKATIRAQVRRKAKTLPASFLFDGRRFPLQYSNLRRFFLCDAQGQRVMASGYFVF